MSPATSSHNKGNNETEKKKRMKIYQQNEMKRTKKGFHSGAPAIRSVQYIKYNNSSNPERHSKYSRQHKK